MVEKLIDSNLSLKIDQDLMDIKFKSQRKGRRTILRK